MVVKYKESGKGKGILLLNLLEFAAICKKYIWDSYKINLVSGYIESGFYCHAVEGKFVNTTRNKQKHEYQCIIECAMQVEKLKQIGK